MSKRASDRALVFVAALISLSTITRAGTISAITSPGYTRIKLLATTGNTNVYRTDQNTSLNTACWSAAGFLYPTTAPLDLVFTVQDSSLADDPLQCGTTYSLSGKINNDSPRDWHAIQLALGFGTGSSFVASQLPGLVFDNTQPQVAPFKAYVGLTQASPSSVTDTSTAWSITVPKPSPTGATTQVGTVAVIDVPNSNPAYIPSQNLISGGYNFTLQVSMATPEPASGSMVMGLTALLVLAQRRRGGGRA